MTDLDRLKSFLELRTETVGLDYKGGHLFDKPALLELVKDIFAMANTRGGGVIIVGVDEVDEGFQNNGIEPSHLALFKEDELKDLVGRCASSVVTFSAKIIEFDVAKYILIQVSEFEEFPVICSCSQTVKVQKNGQQTNQAIFRPGDIFIRTRESRPGTRLIQTHIETKELIDLAVDKASGRLQQRGWNREESKSLSVLVNQGKDLLS